MDFRFVTADEREALYNEVWAEPMTTVAKRYGMSDNGLRKHLKRLGIPLPPVGYWARIKAGQKVKQTPLPKVYGELKKYVRNYVIKFKKDMKHLSDAELMSDEELSLLSEETKEFIRLTCSQIQVKSQLRNPHKLITEHMDEVVYRKKRDKALKQASFNLNYYSTVKSQYRNNKATLPIIVSDRNTKRAYRVTDAIIKTLDDMEGYTRVDIDLETGKDKGAYIVMRTAFYFDIKEKAQKKRSIKGNNETADSFLVLSMTAKSWFDRRLSREIEYKETADNPIENQVGKIIYDMFVVANRIRAEDELKDRELKRKWEEEKRQRHLEQMRKGELEEVKLLEQAASDWEKGEKIRRFADCMEKHIIEVADEEKREKLLLWLKWARDKADWLDPLTDKEDEMLGRSQHLFERILNESF